MRRQKIGTTIQTARIKKGLSCAELAEKCNVTRFMIYHWESAKYVLPKNFGSISAALKIPLRTLEAVNQPPKKASSSVAAGKRRKWKLATFIAFHRQRRGLSRAELGKRLSPSLGRIQIGNLETGTTPRLLNKYIPSLAKLLDVSKGEIEALNPKAY